jgi:nicotinate-nucleotide adenylyltransferase
VTETLNKIKRRKDQYRALGRKIRCAIIGGAFDPIHNGHFQLAQFVLNAGKFDEVWLMPCWKHRFNKEMASFDHRLAMCGIAVTQDRRINVSTYERDHEFTGETYHLVKRLLEEPFAQNEYEFSFVLSMDNANSFDKWYNFEHLRHMIPFVVVSRQGYVPNPNVTWYLNNPPHIYLPAETEIAEISSTAIRENLWNGDNAFAAGFNLSFAQKWLPPGVPNYIVLHGLYKNH